MVKSWLVRIYSNQTLLMFKECAGPVELGRQDHRVPERLFQLVPHPQRGFRIPIARTDEVSISRRTAWIEEISEHRVIVRNLSERVSLQFATGQQLAPGKECEANLPVVFSFGGKVVRIQEVDATETARAIQSLDSPTSLPVRGESAAAVFASLELHASPVPDSPHVIGWLGTVIRVLQSAATDVDFFEKAAQAAVELVRLDSGRVLVKDGDEWTTATTFSRTYGDDEEISPPSRFVLNRVCEEKKTFWFDPLEIDRECSSLVDVASVVAAPVLDPSGEVVAILYGDRRLHSARGPGRTISKLDAMLTEVLAVGVSAGLARLAQERAKLSLQTKFEQFFTPELARQLVAKPELLAGRDLEITVLLCDIRSFSRITRSRGTAFTLEWTNDVFSTLSDCVMDHQGVLVDYIGDELMAMWGAPEPQADHAERACRAALAMLAAVSSLNQRWQDSLGEPMGVGIGINSGLARVGNTGSRLKFKYGPLGDTVNVASRVQGASKYFKSSLVVTRATRDRLGPEFQGRRLGQARVVNIADPIVLFELCPPSFAGARELCSTYEQALDMFEAREFAEASRTLGRLINVFADDGPSVSLLARAIAYSVDVPETFDPAFRLSGK
jgi:adenylate cyclase